MANIQIPITENGTTILATAGKYCDRNIDVNVNVPMSLMEVHRITLANDLTSGYHNLLSGSDFIKEHGGKDGFVVSITALTPAVVGTPANAFTYACNRTLVQQGSTAFSALNFQSTASGRNVKTVEVKANTWIYSIGIGCVPNWSTEGAVKVNPSASYPFLAGDYLIMLAVVEG